MSMLTAILAASLMQAAPVDGNFNIPVAQGDHAERLEAMYDEGDYAALNFALFEPATEADLTTGLDWLGMKYRTDGSTYISLSYSRLLEGVAELVPPETGDQFRGTALAALVQAVLAARIDGQQCSDATARAVRADHLIATVGYSPLLELDEEMRRNAAFIVMLNEEVTWTARQSLDQSEVLCTGGMLGMMAGMAGGTMREREAREGEIGRQIEVTPPEGFEYGRRPEAEWVADAERIRQSREAMLLVLLGIDSVPSMEEMDQMMRQPRQ